MKRALVLGSAWTASAAAAVGLGFLAVSLVDAEASPGTVPLAGTSTVASSSDDNPAPGSVAPSGTPAEKPTIGGTAYASCASAGPRVAGAPAAGWSVDDSADPGQVEFRNGTQRVEVHVLCTNGTPTFAVEGPRADDRSGGDRSGTDDSPSTASAPAGGSTTDDPTGRVGGGHGADDPAGDDSGGRTGGGHGSDG